MNAYMEVVKFSFVFIGIAHGCTPFLLLYSLAGKFRSRYIAEEPNCILE
jgi:hypothetical protein